MGNKMLTPDEFEISELLGRKGFAMVNRARSKRDGKEYVLK